MLFVFMLSALADDERKCAEEIFVEYHKLIYEVSYRILNRCQDAEDTLDEVMMSVMKNMDKFFHACRNDIEAQLVIYSRNAAINLYNKNKRRSQKEIPFTFMNEENEFEDIEIADDGETLEEITLSSETVDLVRKHLKRLSLEQQDTIKLVYGLGYSNAEAAQVLHISSNAVGLRLYKAKKKLLEWIGGELNACTEC